MRKAPHKRTLLVSALLLAMLASRAVFSAQDATLKLSAPTLTNNQAQFTLSCESGVSYVIESSADLQNWSPVATNSDSSISRLIALDAPNGTQFYRASRSQLPLFAAALAAVSTIDLRGNTLATDSYDSGDTNYSMNGLYPFGNVAMTKAGGDLLAGGIFTNSLNVGNADIKGSVKTGPGLDTIEIGVNGTVGDRAWVEGGNLGIQPGHSSTDFNVVFPDVVLPPGLVSPTTKVSNTQTINGTNYTYVFLTSGDYRMVSFGNSDAIYVGTNAHVRIKITGTVSSTAGLIRIANGATLEIYAVQGFSLGGAAWIDNASGHPERFYLYGLPSCTVVNFGGNASFYGCIYAPEAAFAIGGGGSNVYDFIGATVTRALTANGHYYFHFDENLKRIGPGR